MSNEEEVSGQLSGSREGTRCYGFGYKPDTWDVKEFDPEKAFDDKPLIKTACLIHNEGRLKWFARQLYNLIINGYTEERRPLHFEVYQNETVNRWVRIDAWREA